MSLILPDQSWSGIVRSLGLSAREAQIARLILRDDSRDHVMAASMAISPHTVHTHLGRLYRKLGVTNRCQLVTRIFERYVELSSVSRSRVPTAAHTTAISARTPASSHAVRRRTFVGRT